MASQSRRSSAEPPGFVVNVVESDSVEHQTIAHEVVHLRALRLCERLVCSVRLQLNERHDGPSTRHSVARLNPRPELSKQEVPHE
jgi:hypothetical protein